MQTKPIILLPGSFSENDLRELQATNKLWKTADVYDYQLRELAEIHYPDGDPGKRREFIEGRGSGNLVGTWVYYPWSGVLMHCVGEEDLYVLRTNRNQNLITAEEQRSLSEATLAVAGMSVGSGIALSCVYSGMSSTIKLADFDSLSTANLNRLRESVVDVGTPKIDLATRHVYEINPFAVVQGFAGIDLGNINDFFCDPKAAVVVDEIDDFKMKVQLRLKAKEMRTPLLMFTSLGDNILVDVERYDMDPKLAIFNGAIGDVSEEILRNGDITPEDVKRYSVQLVGRDYVPTKALSSLLEMGKSLVGRPQLYSTISVDSGLAAYAIKSILLGSPIRSGRYFIRFSELLGMPGGDLAESTERKAVLQKLFGDK